jgi:hypothetical protein
VEIFGKRQHVGRVAEVERFGVKMMRLEALQPDGSFATMFYGGAAIFGDHEVTEEKARLLVVPRRGWPCDGFKAPSARPGFCADCGHRETEHAAVPQLGGAPSETLDTHVLEILSDADSEDAVPSADIARILDATLADVMAALLRLEKAGHVACRVPAEAGDEPRWYRKYTDVSDDVDDEIEGDR